VPFFSFLLYNPPLGVMKPVPKGPRRSQAFVADRETADYDRERKRKLDRKLVVKRAEGAARALRASSEDREAAVDGFHIPKKSGSREGGRKSKRKVAFLSSPDSSGSDYYSASGSAPGSDPASGPKLDQRLHTTSKRKVPRMAAGSEGSPARFKSPAAPCEGPGKSAGTKAVIISPKLFIPKKTAAMTQKPKKIWSSLAQMDYMQKEEKSDSEASEDDHSSEEGAEDVAEGAGGEEGESASEDESEDSGDATGEPEDYDGERRRRRRAAIDKLKAVEKAEGPPQGQDCAITRANTRDALAIAEAGGGQVRFLFMYSPAGLHVPRGFLGVM